MADIHSKVPTDEFRSNFDRIFGAKSEPDAEPLIVAGVQNQGGFADAGLRSVQEPFICIAPFNKDCVQFSSGGSVVLEISNGHFKVRGVEVAQGEGEAEAVYAAFKSWLPVSVVANDR